MEANAQGSGEAAPAMQLATIVDLRHTQHACNPPAAHYAAGWSIPQNLPKVLLDSGAHNQMVKLDADSSDGPFDQWPRMAAGKRRCQTSVDSNGMPTIYTPMSRAELDQAQKTGCHLSHVVACCERLLVYMDPPHTHRPSESPNAAERSTST